MLGSCVNCGLQIEVEEMTSNVAFLVDGKAVTECPKCETPLVYEEVVSGSSQGAE